jgi:hypothetical protein
MSHATEVTMQGWLKLQFTYCDVGTDKPLTSLIWPISCSKVGQALLKLYVLAGQSVLYL